MIVACPLGERNLANELRLDPVATLHFGTSHSLPEPTGLRLWQIDERTFGTSQRFKLFVERPKQSLVETGAYFGDEIQFITIKVADENSAEKVPRSFRLSIASNDELLGVDYLNLPPTTTPLTNLVLGIQILGNNAFQVP